MTAIRILGRASVGLALTALVSVAGAAPMTYEVDSNHTYPTFEADHMGGLSKWRGKINSTSGTIVLDKAAGTGSVNLSMDMGSLDFGHEGMSDHAKSEDMFHVEMYPTATYTGELAGFQNGSPTRVEGELTMHGQTHPVTLAIGSFQCMQHPRMGREVCGADASADIDRSTWGIDYGAPMFNMGVTLRISIEAVVAE